MKTNRISSEQLLKILISEIDEIRNINNSFRTSLKDFSTSINVKLNVPIKIDSTLLEQNISMLDTLSGVNERANEQFIRNFDRSIKKGQKLFFWTPYILGLMTVLCLISGYYNFKLYSQNKKLNINHAEFNQFLSENDKAYEMYVGWINK